MSYRFPTYNGAGYLLFTNAEHMTVAAMVSSQETLPMGTHTQQMNGFFRFYKYNHLQ